MFYCVLVYYFVINFICKQNIIYIYQASILSRVDGEFLLEPVSKEELHRHEWSLSMKKDGLPKEKRTITSEGMIQNVQKAKKY